MAESERLGQSVASPDPRMNAVRWTLTGRDQFQAEVFDGPMLGPGERVVVAPAAALEATEAEVTEAQREAVEARNDLGQTMAECNVRQGELDDIARLVGVGVDAPYYAVLRGVERLREALSEALDAMVHRPVDSELFLSAIAHAAAALGQTEEADA